MLKSAYAASYDNFKCGEIFCISPPAVFNVTCVVCEQNVPFDEFVTHFQIQHLTLVEKTISLEDLAIGTQTKLEDDVDLDLDTDIKAEDPVDDPIKQDSIGKIPDIDSKNIHNNEDFDEDKCLLQLINESKQKRGSKTKRSVSRKPTGRTAKKTRRTKTKQDAENDTKVEKLEDNLDSNENLHNDNGKAILNEQRDNDEDTDDCKDYDIDYKDDKEEEEDDDEDKEDDDEDYWPDEKEEGDDDKNTKVKSYILYMSTPVYEILPPYWKYSVGKFSLIRRRF